MSAETMIEYSKTKSGDILRIVGRGERLVRVLEVHSSSVLVEDSAGKKAQFIFRCGAARLEPTEWKDLPVPDSGFQGVRKTVVDKYTPDATAAFYGTATLSRMTGEELTEQLAAALLAQDRAGQFRHLVEMEIEDRAEGTAKV